MKSKIFLSLILLSAQYLFCQNENEPNNSFNNANNLVITNLMSTIKGSINPDDDEDFFSFTISKPGVVNFVISNIPDNIKMKVDLYHESNQNLSNSDYDIYATDPGVNVVGNFKVCKTGKYFLRLREGRTGFYENPNQYNLKITIDETDIYECNDNYNSAFNTNCNTPIFASINTINDIDCYKFNLTKQDIITANITNVPSNLDITATLQGPVPLTTELKKVTGGTGQSFSLVSPQLQPGEYILCLTDNALSY